MADIKSILKNGITREKLLLSEKTNVPKEYADRQTEYFGAETKASIHKFAKYAADYMAAQAQGIIDGDFYTWISLKLRMFDVFSKTTNVNLIEDFKYVVFDDNHVDYIALGAKIKTMGSTYIVTNPANVSAPAASAIVRRCNAVYGTLDYYGNAVYEPFVWRQNPALATGNDYQENMVKPNGYQHSVMQINENTAGLHNNTRIILGSSAFAVRGLVDFTREFTDEKESARLYYFDLYQMEPTEYDDMERGIAGAKAFSWTISVAGGERMSAGKTQQITASSLRNRAIPDTESHPVSYIYSSSDESVLIVDENGVVTAVSEGSAVITATLAQNTDMSGTLEIIVEAPVSGSAVQFDAQPPKSLKAFETVQISATYYEDGEPTDSIVGFEISGANENCYSAEISGNTLMVTCYRASEVPLIITASYGERSATAKIRLERY